eukprot:1195038-Prorocentrum_minimum.AAC.1
MALSVDLNTVRSLEQGDQCILTNDTHTTVPATKGPGSAKTLSPTYYLLAFTSPLKGLKIGKQKQTGRVDWSLKSAAEIKAAVRGTRGGQRPPPPHHPLDIPLAVPQCTPVPRAGLGL